MPLSEYEQRVLEQMERELTSDDPRLATTLKSTAPRSGTRYVVAGVGLVVGLLALVVGVAQSVPWVGVVGFVIMFSAVTYALAQPARRQVVTGPIGTVSADGAIRRPTGRRGGGGQGPRRGAASSRGSFMERLEERWDRRRRGE
ncbi:DUF3040 domain-containing protein [Sanguibacter suaedae]|uniref:DUF3040 domain-containing protein n=1 Tax=Sanguibacter suaedae TaxID=2795737 RepID=A0A934I4K2_9MICO|nr:DUF3040 domain-containing protein [Sanguibacter suaedae]MBI9115474.1 DUF3040 domain-containing protein [Sanguibacter suaedae]